MFTGANTDNVHLSGIDIERDIAVSRWVDLREVVAGEPCTRCGEPPEVQRAIEVGHIFKLGYRYSDALGAAVLDAEGQRTTIIMGSYGIGVERALAAIVECHHDDRGIVWPLPVASFHVGIVMAQPNHVEAARVSE